MTFNLTPLLEWI